MYEMTTVFLKFIENQKRVAVFPIRECWIDIGNEQDFVQANDDYHKTF